MPKVQTDTLVATCGHSQTLGDSTVLADGKPISKVGYSKGGGVILGPGSQSVFVGVGGHKVSLIGDIIEAHSPCPDPSIHCAALVHPPGAATVFAGTGIATTPEEVEEGLLPGFPDIIIDEFYIEPAGIYPAGYVFTNYPPENMLEYRSPPGDPVKFHWRVKNIGLAPSPAFNVGFWLTPPADNPAGPFNLTRSAGIGFGALLKGEVRVNGLNPQATDSGVFILTNEDGGEAWRVNPDLTPLDFYYAVHADIDAEVAESSEANWFVAIPLTVDFGG
jgi:hypothetical protein